MNINYTSRWLFQKIFAVLFLIASLYVIYSISNVKFHDYEEVAKWFKNYLNSFSVLVMLSSIILHSNIGLSSIIDDYVHSESLKNKIVLIKNFFFVVLFFITIFSLTSLFFL